MIKSSGRVESHNPKMKDYMAQSIFMPSSVKRKRRRFSLHAFVASIALVLVFSGVFALMNGMTTAADGTASITIKNLGEFSRAQDLCPDVFAPHQTEQKE